MIEYLVHRRPRHRATRPMAAALAAAATLTLAGCGLTSSPDQPVSASTVTAPPSATALQQQFVAVVKQVGPAVVLIRTSEGLGSGVVFNGTGDIVTNNHVVGGARSFQVVLPDGRQFPARLVGAFPPDDLAVLHIDATGLRPAAFADSSDLAVGDIALAIGNPLGLQSSVTQGIVSALGRTVNEDDGIALPNAIQTSAPINPGNSGGALVNLQGQVIGIPTLAATDPQLGGGQAAGIGFAVPSNTVRDIAGQLITRGQVTKSDRAYLGVAVATTTGGRLLITQVTPDGPAARAGLRAGEQITGVSGTPTPDQGTLADVLAQLSPGRRVPVTVVTLDGTARTIQVTLGEYPG